jgi:hypothetical protein
VIKTQKNFFVLLVVLFLSSLYLNIVQLQQKKPSSVQVASVNQESVLCDVAKEHLHEHWDEQRSNIEKVIHVVNSPAEMQAKFKSDLTEIANAVGLSEEDLKSLEVKYQPVFNNHVELFRSQLNQKEPNWNGMFETLKKFYQAEDKIMTETFGQPALEKFRTSQAKKRITMLALIGQYAGLSWDQNISW